MTTTKSPAELTNEAEHNAVHLLAHLDSPVAIQGRTSALQVAPDADCVVSGELIHDSDFRCRKLIYAAGSTVTTDPSKSFAVEVETCVQSHGAEFSDVCDDPAVKHTWRFLPRTHEDKADLGGGFVFMGHTAVRGAAKADDDLARNIVFESAATDEVWKRGHIMGMHAPPSDWQFYEVRGMGRTRSDIPISRIKLNPSGTVASADYKNRVGIYAEHGHWRTGGNDLPSRRTGVVYRDFLKWGGVNHGGYMIFARCIALEPQQGGAGFAAENGLERGGFYNCTTIGARGPTGHKLTEIRTRPREAIDDWGWQGSGFWLQGGGMEVVDCRAVDCNVGVDFWARPLKEISARSYDPKWLRDGPLKTHAMVSGKPIDNATVPLRVVGLVTENCERGVDLAFQEGIEPSEISGCTINATARAIDSHYSKAGLLLKGNTLTAPHAMLFSNNFGHSFRYIDNRVFASISGLEDPGAGAVEILGNRFQGASTHDIKLRHPNPTVAHTINGQPFGPAATAAVRDANKRVVEAPSVVVGL